MERVKVSFGEPVFIHNGMNTVCKLNYHLKLGICEGIKGQVVTVAKFNPDDKEYNEHIGEKVALAKAEIKARKEAKRFLLGLMKFINTELDRIENAISEIGSFNIRDRESIERILS